MMKKIDDAQRTESGFAVTMLNRHLVKGSSETDEVMPLKFRATNARHIDDDDASDGDD